MTNKNVKFVWTDLHKKAFEKIKKNICQQVMLTFPDFSKPFHIYTDVSDTQLGVNTSGNASAQIPQLPLGDNSPPWGR
jgi:hypothetical protein